MRGPSSNHPDFDWLAPFVGYIHQSDTRPGHLHWQRTAAESFAGDGASLVTEQPSTEQPSTSSPVKLAWTIVADDDGRR